MQSRLSLTNVVTCHFKTHGFSLRITVKKEKKTCKAVTVATPAGVKISYILQSIFLIFFYWIIFTSQCCVSFCCITKWISYMYKYIPSLLDFSPSSSLYPYLLKSFCFMVRCFALEQIAEKIFYKSDGHL